MVPGWGEERETSVLEKHRLGSNPQPRHVPQTGVKPATVWCMGPHSKQLSHTGRAFRLLFIKEHLAVTRGEVGGDNGGTRGKGFQEHL